MAGRSPQGQDAVERGMDAVAGCQTHWRGQGHANRAQEAKESAREAWIKSEWPESNQRPIDFRVY
ncbi:hypothetical protein PC120_g28035 [Phytophthora cactorum]|nr:hypothetical protein PC120_g28035 [Phytophthora cactorum]